MILILVLIRTRAKLSTFEKLSQNGIPLSISREYINPYLLNDQMSTRLPFLQVLDLSQNFISDLPKDIGGLKSLYELNLDDNYITEIPSTIGYLKNLQTLIVSNNEIVKFPDIKGLNELIILIASENVFDDIIPNNILIEHPYLEKL
jgi:Leucine-rich repeat (LRR) protein